MVTQSKCPYCGTPVSPVARYCDNCGTPLKPSDRPTPTRRRERPNDRVAVWLFVVVLIVVFTGGTLGGFRYRSGQWPWQPPVAPVVSSDPPSAPENPTVTIPPPSNPPVNPSVERYHRSMVSISVRGDQGSKTGSGFLIDPEGHILTSAHVVEGYQGCVNVIDDYGASHLAAVVGLDRNLDVALLQAATLRKWPDVLSLYEEPVAAGDQVYVLGSPKSNPNASLLDAEVESIRVSKRIEERYYPNLIEFRGVTVVHGSSGSPLIHRQSGQVLGIVTAAADTPVAYAVPTDEKVRDQITQWIAEPTRSECGVQASQKTVRVVLSTITPLSGSYGIYGGDLSAGAELALRDMEDQLRKVGYEVTLLRHDDQGQASAARDLANSVAFDPEVIGVVGSFTSQVSAAIAEALQESKLVMIAPTAGADELTAQGWPHFNRLIASNARLEALAASYAQSKLGARSILLILDGTPAAESKARSFETSAQIISMSLAGQIKLTGTIDPADLKQKVIDSKADAIFYAGNSQTAFQMAQALRHEGITLPIIGGAELYSNFFENMIGPAWRGIYFTHFTDGGDERFARHFETIMGKPTRGYGMYGYDAARVILEALVRYGEKNPAKVPDRTELAQMVRTTREFHGWASTISFDSSTGENQAARVHVFEWVSGRPEWRESDR